MRQMRGPGTTSLPSARDVAENAGVSPATVSRAFSEPGLLREETLARVLAVAEERGYRPKRPAGGSPRKGTQRIGVIVPDLGNPFFPAILKGAQTKARELGYAVFLADADENPRLEADLVRAMASEVDGIVICSSRLSRAELEQLVPATTLVLLNRRVRGVSSVLFDNAGGIRQAIDHLVALGHRRIAFLSGPANSWSNQERRRGLRLAARAHGVDVLELGPFAPHFDAGQHAADLALAEDVTAIQAYNDLMALGVLSRLAARGVAVPDEISVVGFDNIQMAAMAMPHLTTVALPLEVAGRVAIELLSEQLDDTRPRSAHEQTLDAQLIVRASTAPPRERASHQARPAPR
jgi:DNA-binding LacI/PurR family transcriptional regulator